MDDGEHPPSAGRYQRTVNFVDIAEAIVPVSEVGLPEFGLPECRKTRPDPIRTPKFGRLNSDA